MLVLRSAIAATVLGLVMTPGLLLAAQAPGAQPSDVLERAGAEFRAGLAAQQAGQLEEARARFADAVRLAPAIAESHEALGAVLMELDKPDQAVPEFEAALARKPGDPGIETDLALALTKSGSPDKAIPYFSAVYRASPQPGAQAVDAGFCEAYARALAAVGKLAESLGLFQAAAERGASGPGLDDAVGSLYAQLGSFDQARTAFERAIAADKSYLPARIHLGILLRQQHDPAGSLAAFAAALAVDPASPAVHLEYARTLSAAGQDREALPDSSRQSSSSRTCRGRQ